MNTPHSGFPSVDVLRIGFVGAGRLGKALAWSLSRAGLRVSAVASTALADARTLADAIPGCVAASAQAVIDTCDLVFITTPDGAIASTTAALRWHPSMAAVHCSGFVQPFHRADVPKAASRPLARRSCQTLDPTGHLMHYAPVFLTLISAVLGVFGKTWEPDRAGIKRVTWKGWTVILLAVISSVLTIKSTAQDRAEKASYRAVALAEIVLATDRLLDPFRSLYVAYKGPGFIPQTGAKPEREGLAQLRTAVTAQALVSNEFLAHLE